MFPDYSKTPEELREEWCRLGGVTSDFAKLWLGEVNWWLYQKSKYKVTKRIADAWVAEALG